MLAKQHIIDKVIFVKIKVNSVHFPKTFSTYQLVRLLLPNCKILNSLGFKIPTNLSFWFIKILFIQWSLDVEVVAIEVIV